MTADSSRSYTREYQDANQDVGGDHAEAGRKGKITQRQEGGGYDARWVSLSHPDSKLDEEVAHTMSPTIFHSSVE